LIYRSRRAIIAARIPWDPSGFLFLSHQKEEYAKFIFFSLFLRTPARENIHKTPAERARSAGKSFQILYLL